MVYATIIDEALSRSMADIEANLMKLKRDLHIGKEGYPKLVTLAREISRLMCSHEGYTKKVS